MKFTCVGFDVRKYPCRFGFSADNAEWERDEKWYLKLARKCELSENEYNLLNITNNNQLQSVIKYAKDIDSCDLTAIELPLDVVKFYDSQWGYETSSNTIDLREFVCHGFDICDADGLITLFNDPLVEAFRGSNGLVPESRLIDALEGAQLANVVAPTHRPCVVAKVYSLKNGLNHRR